MISTPTTVSRSPAAVNQFTPSIVAAEQLAVPAVAAKPMRVIEALDGQLITNCISVEPRTEGGKTLSDVNGDVLKLVVVNRYRAAEPAVAFIRNFGLRRGAMASSVAHDSHNVIAVGVDDDDLAAAINAVMNEGGALSAACRATGEKYVLPLPIAGLMSPGSCEEVGDAYQQLDRAVKAWGSELRAPYMTLSFMALLVIPALKLSDLGLFNGEKFAFTDLFE